MKSTKYSFKIIFVILTTILLSSTVFGYIFGNGSGGGYGDDGEDTSGGRLANITIEMYVIEGARYFLLANSDVMKFMNRVENYGTEGFDSREALLILDHAYEKLQYAAAVYYYLIRQAENTPYNNDVIAKLKDFDYTGFMAEYGLNSVTFKEVEGYLKNGDITGIYKNIYARFKTILQVMMNLKSGIDSGNFPSLYECWNLSEMCSQTLIFGQYVSRVFYAL